MNRAAFLASTLASVVAPQAYSSDARLLDEQVVRVSRGRFADGYTTGKMDRLFALYARQRARTNAPLLLHFHGGLVDSAHAIARAHRLAAAYTPSGAYPVFYIWHAGIEDTLAAMPLDGSLGTLAQVEWLAHGPIVALLGLVNRNRQIHRAVREREHNTTAHGEVTAQEELFRRVGNPAIAAFWRTLNESVDRSFDHAQGAGAYELQNRIAEMCNAGLPLRVVLIGHSMGAIHALRFALSWRKAAAHGTLAANLKFDVILLGPAVGFDEAMAAVDSGAIGNFRVFGLSDEYERRDAIARWYGRSLLYFVSGVLEPYADFPLVGMQRFWSDAGGPHTRQSVAKLQSSFAAPVAVWSPASVLLGACNNAHTHSALDYDPLVVSSINELVMRGFG